MTQFSFTIRTAVPSDAEQVVEIYNQAVRTTTATFDTELRTVADQRRRLQQHCERFPMLVAEHDGRIIGWAAMLRWSERKAYDRTAETSLYVHEDHRGRGVGRTLKEKLVRHARDQGMHTLISRAADGADASEHITRTMGFEHIGTMKEVGYKFGRWLDVRIFQLMLGEKEEDGRRKAENETD